MRPVPIPDHIRAQYQTVVIGEPGMSPADDGAPMPAEYVVTPSELYPGRPAFSALVALDQADIDAIKGGADLLWLTLDGGEVPWAITVADVRPREGRA